MCVHRDWKKALPRSREDLSCKLSNPSSTPMITISLLSHSQFSIVQLEGVGEGGEKNDFTAQKGGGEGG